MVGRVDLNPVAPPKYDIGYWIDAEHTGCGHASSAVALAVAFASDDMGATDVYGEWTRATRQACECCVADLGSYGRSYLPLDGEAPRNAL